MFRGIYLAGNDRCYYLHGMAHLRAQVEEEEEIVELGRRPYVGFEGIYHRYYRDGVVINRMFSNGS